MGLALASIAFDLVFMAQHYVIYAEVGPADGAAPVILTGDVDPAGAEERGARRRGWRGKAGGGGEAAAPLLLAAAAGGDEEAPPPT
jgi:hypothetical protein